MSSAARSRIEDEPDPAPEDPRAKAGRVLDAHLALIERADALLGTWRDACPQDSQAVPALRELITETIGAGLHAEEMRQALAEQTATAWTLDAAFAAGRAAERAEAESPASSPGPRHAAEPRRKGLRLVGGGGVAAFAGAAFTGLRHAWAVHPVATTAAGFTVATLAATTAVVVPHAAATFGVGGGPSAPAPAAGIYSAVPVSSPSQKLIAAVSGHKGSSGTLTFNLPPSVPSYAPQDAPPAVDPSAPDPALPSSLPVSVPDVRLVVTSALDLGAGSSGMIRLAAYGGAVSWSASTSVAGLTLDSSSGTLSAGDATTVTVTIGADLQALDGPAQVTISYGNGKTAVVPVSWTIVPLPLPTVVPTDVLPSALPTIAGV